MNKYKSEQWSIPMATHMPKVGPILPVNNLAQSFILKSWPYI